jgi:hypothetical protein
VPALLAGRDLVERDQAQPDGLRHRGLRRTARQAPAHLLKPFLETAPWHIILRGKVAEERAPPDPCGPRDVPDGGPFEALPVEQSERHLLKLGAGGHPPAADRRG